MRRSPIPASLLDIHFVHDAMNHPLVGAFFAKIEREEIMPTVPPVPGVVLDDYYHLIHRRFSNPKIGDTIPRLAFDGSNRQPKFIVPVARDRLKAGGSVDALAFESALWCRHCFGKTETGKDITAGDPIWPRLTELAAKAKADPLAWLSMDDVYGDVGQSESSARPSRGASPTSGPRARRGRWPISWGPKPGGSQGRLAGHVADHDAGRDRRSFRRRTATASHAPVSGRSPSSRTR